MTDFLPEVFYAFAKFVAYCLWCWVGLRLFSPERAKFSTSIKYGAVRWLLGLGFGLAVAIVLGSVERKSVATLYFGIYIPLRVIEWTIMALLIGRSSPQKTLRTWLSVLLWVLGGIVVSFVSDLASPDGMAGRFCVGRCLC